MAAVVLTTRDQVQVVLVEEEQDIVHLHLGSGTNLDLVVAKHLTLVVMDKVTLLVMVEQTLVLVVAVEVNLGVVKVTGQYKVVDNLDQVVRE